MSSSVDGRKGFDRMFEGASTTLNEAIEDAFVDARRAIHAGDSDNAIVVNKVTLACFAAARVFSVSIAIYVCAGNDPELGTTWYCNLNEFLLSTEDEIGRRLVLLNRLLLQK